MRGKVNLWYKEQLECKKESNFCWVFISVFSDLSLGSGAEQIPSGYSSSQFHYLGFKWLHRGYELVCILVSPCAKSCKAKDGMEERTLDKEFRRQKFLRF